MLLTKPKPIIAPEQIRVLKSAISPRSWQTWLIGKPLPTESAPDQTIGKAIGLAVFASDALSSTAYATQEILVILVAAGPLALGFSFPIAIAIVALLAIVTLSYEQTIHAYPGGGGAYIVARDNLGELPAQTAGAALLTGLYPDCSGFDFIRCGPDHFRLPRPAAYKVIDRGRHGAVHHADQPARGERIWHHIRYPDLLLPGHDELHSGCRFCQATLADAWAR